MKYTLNIISDPAGFAAENVRGPSTIKVRTRGLFTSDDPDFYHYSEQLSNVFLSPLGLSVDSIHKFLVVIHADLKADVYVNDFQVVLNVRPKRVIKRGEPVFAKDIADMNAVTFPDVTITDTDKVIYCFKVGWRFGLFYDLTQRVQPANSRVPVQTEKLDVQKMNEAIGVLYRYLAFYHVYKALESEAHFQEMIIDGWFPFIEIASDEFKLVSKAYQNRFDFENKIRSIQDRFTPDRIDTLTSKWWNNPVFSSKQKLINAGVKAYLQGSEDGYINCIKTLGSEIEGVLRQLYLSDTGKGERVKTDDLIEHIVQKATQATGSEYSLLLPRPFLEYLKEVIFASFNVETGDVQLSRHSSAHGIADANLYTRERALQFILVVDQIYYYV